jgi:Holliday junction resolvase-like predicted endonuclease
MLESEYQAKLVKKLESLFNGCVIMKNDANYRQGFPDLLVLFNNAWAVLEVKESATAPYRPNQEWYLDKLRKMSFSATIYPENEREVLTALREFFGEIPV